MEKRKILSRTDAGLTLIVKTVVGILTGFILIYGAAIVLYGHLTPGGGFAGGVIIAGAFILLVLAFGKKETFKKLSERTASTLDSLGALAFLLIAVLGLFWGSGLFFNNFLGKGKLLELASAGIAPFCNLAIAVKVFAGLFAVFVGLAGFRVIPKGKK